jgi:SAM-dependent methyltransferase
MRRKFVESHPGTAIIAERAEAIGLADGTVDAVVCAQAFHWFDAPKAIEEIYRVLKPSGRLGLIWNVRDESVPWVAKLTEIIDVHAGDTPRYRDGKWRQAFNQTKLFAPLQEARFPHVQRGGLEMVLDRVASISFIAALPDDDRNSVLAKIRGVLLSDVLVGGREDIEFPYVAHALWCEKL